jgi:hypothetical protein
MRQFHCLETLVVIRVSYKMVTRAEKYTKESFKRRRIGGKSRKLLNQRQEGPSSDTLVVLEMHE